MPHWPPFPDAYYMWHEAKSCIFYNGQFYKCPHASGRSFKQIVDAWCKCVQWEPFIGSMQDDLEKLVRESIYVPRDLPAWAAYSLHILNLLQRGSCRMDEFRFTIEVLLAECFHHGAICAHDVVWYLLKAKPPYIAIEPAKPRKGEFERALVGLHTAGFDYMAGDPFFRKDGDQLHYRGLKDGKTSFHWTQVQSEPAPQTTPPPPESQESVSAHKTPTSAGVESHQERPPKVLLSGRIEGARVLVEIGGSTARLQNQSFEILLRLALALKADGHGWVPQDQLGLTRTITRPFNDSGTI